MGKPYSEDLRRNVVHAIESGHTYEETAELCGVSISSVSRFVTRWRNSGSVSPEKFGGYKSYALERYGSRITRWLDAQPDITLAELQARLAEGQVAVSQTSIFRFLRHLGFTFKKNCTRPNKTGRTWPQHGKPRLELHAILFLSLTSLNLTEHSALDNAIINLSATASSGLLITENPRTLTHPRSARFDWFTEALPALSGERVIDRGHEKLGGTNHRYLPG